ncbi:MAG TPA: NAD-dependent epimerase/dehydratase family protein [Actinomycetota bacterium]|nr:NAD-dependent epimerase/dehydratase family protein [Actinomycetota bacterium]
MRRVLVTGGAGFVGSHIVDELLGHGIEVVALDLLHPAAHARLPDYLHPDAEQVTGDVRDVDLAERCLRGVDAVCHQAAMVGLGTDLGDVTEYVSHNDLGTASLLSAFHRKGFRGRLVLASSMVVYGEGSYRCPVHGEVRPEPRPVERLAVGRFEPNCPRCGRDLAPGHVGEDAPPDPRNVYAATKVHQEHLCAAWGREAGATVTALRYHNVYGERMPRDTPYAGVASIFRSALEGGRPPLVFEDGGQLRDFVDVRDVAHANVLALLADTAFHGPLNVASGEPHSIADMAAALADAIPDAPGPLVTGRYRLGDVRHVVASPERAEHGLGFRAAIRFDEGMRRFATAPLRDPVVA